MRYFLFPQNEALTRKQVNAVEKFFKKDNHLLDAGCGIGRHSILLAKDGFSVLGIDNVPLYIEKAKVAASSYHLPNAKFLQMDVRTLSYENTFDGVLSLWSSFGYFSDDINFSILRKFYKALKKGGKLIIDIENRDYILKYFVRDTFNRKGDIFIVERRKFHPLSSIVSTRRYIVGKDIYKEYLRDIRIYSATEIINLYKQIGFNRIQVFGNYELEKFTIDAKRIIIYGERT